MTLFGGVISLSGVTFFMLCAFAILAVGYMLGRISVKGVSLGSAGVFVAALVFGALFCSDLTGNPVNYGDSWSGWFKVAESLGLIFFVTGVGYIAGPNFFSNLKKNIAEVMKREGYIWDYQIIEAQPVNVIRIQLKYGPNGERVIRHIKRVSKPGCRVYSSAEDLKPVLNGLGISVVSTSQGLMSDREAKAKKNGGEIICEIW